jgi:hypothetical protein
MAESSLPIKSTTRKYSMGKCVGYIKMEVVSNLKVITEETEIRKSVDIKATATMDVVRPIRPLRNIMLPPCMRLMHEGQVTWSVKSFLDAHIYYQ